MSEQTEELDTARVVVRFHSSSTKDGREAYQITVLEGATDTEAKRVMALAKELRLQALEALKPPSLEQQLEQSLA